MTSTSNSEVGDSDQSLTSENDRNSDLTDIDMTLESLNRYHEEILEALQASGIAYGLTSMASDMGSETDLRGASGGASAGSSRRPGLHDVRADGGASSSSSSSKKGEADTAIYSETQHYLQQQQHDHHPLSDYGGN